MKTTDNSVRNDMVWSLVLVPLYLIAFAIFVPAHAAAQERPIVKVGVELETGWLKTSYENESFMTQRARTLNKVLTVEVNPFERLGLHFRTDIDGKVTDPAFDDLHGSQPKLYKVYEGHDSLMEGFASFRVSESLGLEVLAGWSRMEFAQDYIAQDVGLPDAQTVDKRTITSPMIGLGYSKEWENASISARGFFYPMLTKKYESVQYYQGLEIRPDIGDEDGTGFDFRLAGEYAVWENISIGASYQWREMNTYRLRGLSATTAVKVGEKIAGQYLAAHIGVRW